MRRALPALLLLTACGGGPAPAPTSAPAASADGPDGNVRLDRSVRPTRYDLDLTIDPARDTFSGAVEIQVELAAPTAEIRMHGHETSIETARATVDGRAHEAAVALGPNGGLALRFGEPLPAGPATLSLRYTAPLPEVPHGLYRVEERGAWYAFTQFEPLHAREAFPSFDQPEFKTPFATTLRVPKGQIGLTNGPQVSQRDDGEHTVYTFAETRPLPTYLVAFAVGPFDLVEAPEGAVPDTPFRIVATRGKGRLAQYALERTPHIHAALSEYFGRGHPFAKLDQVAVPNFAAGAMENVGLVTYRETLLLLDGDTAPAHRKMWSQSVIAHELAHMWFGNLVTMAWWDDLWLNEAFATWMAAKIVHQVDPALEMNLQQLQGTRYVMRLDAQKHARAIRQPIRHGGDVENAFDGITYGKGAAVLRMLEAWIGAEPFRAGVHAYLEAAEYGTATTDDLLNALGQASGKPVAEVVRNFLDQPGTPLVDVVSVECADGGPATITLRQSRYLPIGSDAPQGEPWRVPVCLRYPVEGEKVRQIKRACFELGQKQQSFTLPEKRCPAWVHPNADQDGYYQWKLPTPQLLALAGEHRERLSKAERVALPGVFAALLEAGELEVGPFLEGLERLSAEAHRIVLEGVIGGLSTLHHAAVDEGLEPAFAAKVRALLGPHAKRLGFEPAADEPVATKLQRPAVINAVAWMGQDPALRGKARKLADAFLADPDGNDVAPELLPMALPMAAWDGDEALWKTLREALDRPLDPVTRLAVVNALGSFESPTLITRSLDLVLDGTLRAQDFRSVARGISRPTTREAAWAWLMRNYDALLERLGANAARRLPQLAGGFCDASRRAEVEAFFSVPKHAPEGTERNLGLTLGSIDRCIRLRAATRGPLRDLLKAEARKEDR